MKRNVLVKVIAVCYLCVFFLPGCDLFEPDKDTDENLDLAEELWGEWLRIDADETWYISGDSIYINDEKASISATLIRQSDNVIQVTESGRIYYLYASRTANASFSGRITSFDQGSSSMARSVAGGKGWINVVVDNLNNGTSIETTTDSDGNFDVEDIIPGDYHRISPEGGGSGIVMPITDGDDVGTITVVDGNDVNFKVGISLNNSKLDLNMLTASGYYQIDTDTDFSGNLRTAYKYSSTPSYDFTISIQNTGGKDATAATYQFSLDSGLQLNSGNRSGILGTIEPCRSKSIALNLGCSSGSISGDYTFKKINVTITDPISDKTWTDSVSLRFFKETFMINTLCDSINGLVILPSKETFRFKKMGEYWGGYLGPFILLSDGSVGGSNYNRHFSAIVPKLTSGDYLFVFCGATAETEIEYSLSFMSGSPPDFSSLLSFRDDPLGIDTGRYERNDTEETATVIKGGIRAYLHKNDIDYYRFRFGN